ncbi:DUF4767 domain-containing protein [Periweissella ghanensis]|uniref:DUF4767 domain-containing protein n=1 Tax=Periweissella ghanensis TaxID=467997 RepID=A0ABM8ZAI3_9LACO|nr:DUF4767 domain-containing protein [Periweissella ghanensis]MCM0600559.1 DUF4767 domain-containing protein [Periweissella ghanensis]CAH0418359.1 hypothetical protein WGH24286_00777 [Periweissella ghanensis]
MNKRKILGGLIIVVGALLAGCAQSMGQEHATNTAKRHVMTAQIAKQQPMPTVVWSNRQALALDQFIKEWQKTYKPRRHFLRYFPGVAGSNYLGYSFPQTFSKRNLIYNGGQIKLGISKDGTDKYNYNVVAVYSDATDATAKNADHLYIMTIHNGQPVIFVDTNVAHPKRGFIYLKASQNKQLTTAFSKIFNANTKELALLTPDEKWQPITYQGMTFNYRQLGAMLESYMSLSNEKITAIAHEESFSIMHVENGPLKVGYYNLSPKIGYTYNATQLDMKSNDLVNPQETIPLHNLIMATYRTRAQQRDIDYAAQIINLKP